MRPPEVMAYCYPQIKLTAMPETPSHPAGWVKVEAPPCFQGLEAVQVLCGLMSKKFGKSC